MHYFNASTDSFATTSGDSPFKMRPNALKTLDPHGALDAVSQSAQVMPSNDLVLTVGPVFQTALGRILNGESPEIVAKESVEALK